MEADQAARAAALERLSPFVGEWQVDASFPGSLPGRSVFEWTLNGQYLVQRAQAPDPAPDALCVVAPQPDGQSYTQHYFDSRGVVRLYAMTFDDGVWRLVRESADFSPLPFAQRFTGTFNDDGNTIAGTWEKTNDAGEWELDFAGTYRRRA